MIHIGQLIADELYHQGHSVSWLAKQLCCDRSNVYKILKKTNIDVELLQRISRVMNYNFFQYYLDDFSCFVRQKMNPKDVE